VRGWCAAHACRSFFLSAQTILSSISSLQVGSFLILPIKMKYLIVRGLGSMLAHGLIKPNHVSLLPPFFFVNVGVVIRLKLNFILLEASIHLGQSKAQAYLFTTACLLLQMKECDACYKIQTQFHPILKA
jgi:hypothetical protein